DQQWVESGLIYPEQPSRSSLYTSLIGTSGLGIHNMPPAKSDKKLSKEELEEIENWIVGVPLLKKDQTAGPSLFKGEKFSVTIDSEKSISEAAVYYRCYGQFTRDRPALTDTNLIKIKRGAISGAEGCDSLLKSVYLNFNDKLDPIKNGKYGPNQAILNTFQQFHHNWFGAYNFHTGMESWANSEVMDAGEMAYRLTRALFKPSFLLNRVTKGNDAYEAIRVSKHKSDFLVHKQFGLHDIPWKKAAFMLGNDMKKPIPWRPAPTLMQRGKLVGIRKIPKGRDKIRKFYDSEHTTVEQNVNYDLHENLGGGVLGSSVYLLLNSGQEIGRKMDGGWHVHRRWSKAVLKDLLCRDIPVILPGDASAYVQPKSKLPFRKSTSCMQCHATLGLMAGVVRQSMTGINNIVADQIYDLTNPLDSTVINLQMTVLKHFKVDPELEPVISLPEYDVHYPKRPAYGRFLMRDLYGNLIDTTIKGTEDLGRILSERDDFYVCTAKRYFKFLTGVEVDLNIMERSYRDLDLTSRYFLNLLVKWGRELKITQDLKLLINRIISSPIYSQRDYKVQVGPKKAL
ncbi:MAG: hypothetical protein HOM21_14365, partial [Halobacteriovoraceae bacterium]|nr:hypothetical protein [Halobacteriovoraceae bacterium]